ncbi:MAG: Rpn family recombination-promoting nuclease/putative transposase [Mariniphaga sp.]
MSKYINPYTDFGFKRLFGTEGNKDLLVDFLNCLMPEKHHITDLNFRNTEQPGGIVTDRKAIYDIYCHSANGDRFIVEMQKAKINFFKDRALFYITFPINEQAQKGDWDFKLLPIYYIAILDFPYDEHEEIRKFDRNVQLRDEDGFVFYDKLGFRFLQMPFFNKKETELVTHYDKWCYFLKYLQSFDDIPQILNEPVFDKAFKTAALAAMNPKDREEYEQSKLVYSELKAVMDTSKAEGREQGMEEGIEIGIPKGEINKARKIAKTMKDNGEPIVKIAEYTGLSNEEIEKL